MAKRCDNLSHFVLLMSCVCAVFRSQLVVATKKESLLGSLSPIRRKTITEKVKNALLAHA